MVAFKDLFNPDRWSREEERRALLPTSREHVASAFPAKEVTKIALRLKHQVETVVPCELDEELVSKPHSTIINSAVIETARAAGGEEHKACVVFCLLVCKKWFRKQALLELWDADLHLVRAVACEVLAKRIIESEEDMDYLLEQVLLKRFSILVNGEDSHAANVIEKAVDLHALMVIGSSGYQKCIKYLWSGWLLQDDEDPSRFVPYEHKTDTRYWAHIDPDRMRVPRYQNAVMILTSVAYLALYTGAINSVNSTGDIDVVEGILYIFTLGFFLDEVIKFWKIGIYYIGFWNVFNCTLYALLVVSFVTRMIALSHPLHSERRDSMNVLSYNFLAFTAPFFWIRIMLFLDSFRFFGAMLVMYKVMMKETIIFFALLVFVLIGFWQAFIGLDQVDGNLEATQFILENMIKAILTSPEFDDFDRFGAPFGIILYYIYSFIVMTILLNILIALFGSAYEDISSNSTDEYMALFAAKTLQFARAPDENVYIAPLNLIEIFFLVVPFEWWMSKDQYEWLNDWVMGILYTPVLAVTAYIEQRQATTIRDNRRRGEVDEDTIEEWEQLEFVPERDDEAWAARVTKTSPDVTVDGVTVLVRELLREVQELRAMVDKGKGEAGEGEGAAADGDGNGEEPKS